MKTKILIIILIVLLALGVGTGLAYWKVQRVIHSFIDSARHATSQNTPLSD